MIQTANEVSIVMKMTDDISGTMRSIANSSQSLNKDFEKLKSQAQALGTRYDSFRKEAAKARAEAEALKKEMREQRKAIAAGGDGAAAATKEYQRMTEQYDDLIEASKGYSEAAKNTVRDMRDIAEQARKLEEKQNAGWMEKVFGSGLGSGLAKSGVLRDLGSAVSGALSTRITSAIGQPTADMLSETINGVISGAAAGAIAGMPGMIAGGAIGLVSGGINAASSNFQKKDDAFRDYYKGLYETVNANTEEDLTSGKTLAASRETTKLSFTTLLGGGSEANAFLSDVLQTANTTPFLYDDLVGISKTLLSFNTAAEDVIPTLIKVGDAGAALGLSTSDIGTVSTYLGRMKSSNKATLEYLNPLMERGFSVFEWLAQAKGTSVGGIYNAISKGTLSGTDAVQIILDKFEELYAGQMEKQAKTTEGLESTLAGLKENIQAAMGTGYNARHNESVQADIDAYGGELGKALEQWGLVAGENKAHLENLQSQYQREALEAVLLGKETSVFSEEDAEKLKMMGLNYLDAAGEYKRGSQDAGLEMERLKEQAEALATAAYESSDVYTKYHEDQIDQIDAIRENTKGLSAATDALDISNALSKGLGGGFSIGRSVEWGTGTAAHEQEFQQNRADYYRSLYATSSSHAFGLRRVPFDNYPALLHAGERVQTAEEARRSDRGAKPITINIQEMHVRSDQDIDLLAERLADELEMREMTYGGAAS